MSSIIEGGDTFTSMISSSFVFILRKNVGESLKHDVTCYFRLFNRFDRFKADDVMVYLKPSASCPTFLSNGSLPLCPKCRGGASRDGCICRLANKPFLALTQIKWSFVKPTLLNIIAT